MQIEQMLRLAATVADRAWFRCRHDQSRDLLENLSRALKDVAIEHRQTQELDAEDARKREEAQWRHDAQEKKLRERDAASA